MANDFGEGYLLHYESNANEIRFLCVEMKTTAISSLLISVTATLLQ